MRGKILPLVICLLTVLPGLLPVEAQFTPEESARREEVERFLLAAEIVRSEPIGEGVTKPFKIYLKQDDTERKAVWKNPSGRVLGVADEWRYEIAAYRIDKLIGLNLVPPTVERTFKGKKGSLQIWVENKYSLLDIEEKGIAIPASALDKINKMKYLTRAFDSLIANEDRTQQNIRYTEDWRTILIDHSRAFRSSKQHIKALMFGSHGLKMSAQGRPFLFRRLPRPFVDRLKTLTFAGIQEAVGDSLSAKEIQAVLARRDLLLKEIDDMIQAQTESDVLYD